METRCVNHPTALAVAQSADKDGDYNLCHPCKSHYEEMGIMTTPLESRGVVQRVFGAVTGRFSCKEPNIKVQDCSRPPNHDGPCNGWPCASMREKMGQGERPAWKMKYTAPEGVVFNEDGTATCYKGDGTTVALSAEEARDHMRAAFGHPKKLEGASPFRITQEMVDRARATLLTNRDVLSDAEIADMLETVESAKYDNLWNAVRRLYYAAIWSPDRPVDEAKLWTDVRNAAGFAPGQSPKPIDKGC